MALVIEDGTGSNPAANSYQSVADLRAYAKAGSISLNHKTDAECEGLLIQAMRYLDGEEQRWKGYRANPGQPLAWPRADVWDVEIPGALMPSNEIPRRLENAQCALAIEAMTQDLLPNQEISNKGQVIKEKVGDIEKVYSSDKVVKPYTDAFAKPHAHLAPLYKRQGLHAVRS